jgi:hypothetical protein
MNASRILLVAALVVLSLWLSAQDARASHTRFRYHDANLEGASANTRSPDVFIPRMGSPSPTRWCSESWLEATMYTATNDYRNVLRDVVVTPWPFEIFARRCDGTQFMHLFGRLGHEAEYPCKNSQGTVAYVLGCYVFTLAYDSTRQGWYNVGAVIWVDNVQWVWSDPTALRGILNHELGHWFGLSEGYTESISPNGYPCAAGPATVMDAGKFLGNTPIHPCDSAMPTLPDVQDLDRLYRQDVSSYHPAIYQGTTPVGNVYVAKWYDRSPAERYYAMHLYYWADGWYEITLPTSARYGNYGNARGDNLQSQLLTEGIMRPSWAPANRLYIVCMELRTALGYMGWFCHPMQVLV